MKVIASVVGLIAAGSLGIICRPPATNHARHPAHQPPTPVINVPTPPSDVDLSGASTAADSLQRFDDYSWKAFLAMVWPAQPGMRGAPDTTKTASDLGVPRVFETYKSTWEFFFNSPLTVPADWNVYEDKQFNPTGLPASFGDLILASFSHNELEQAGIGPSFGPLPAQNGYYVRYATSFNQTEFTTMRNNGWNQKQNLKPLPVTFPMGSIDLKSAWILMRNVPHPERYYTRQAYVRLISADQTTYHLEQVGLIGLHIVQKTPLCPQWIWSSFEQEDNVPESSSTAPYTLNAGKGGGQPRGNPIEANAMPPEPTKPFNVCRFRKIPASTEATNRAYHAALPQGSVWRHYKLVVTQWPEPQSQPNNSGNPQHTSPGIGSTTNTANVALETFHQNSIFVGCMNCHTGMQRKADFNWTMFNHAFGQ